MYYYPRKFLVFIMVICVSGIIFGQEVPFEIQSKLILKIISFDKNIDRFGDPIAIGVSTNKMSLVLKKMRSIKINGKSFTVKKVENNDLTGIGILIVDDSSINDSIVENAVKNKILVFSEKYEDLEKGAGVVFLLKEGKPKIAVSLKNASDQGSNFSANFLKVTVIVGEM